MIQTMTAVFSSSSFLAPQPHPYSLPSLVSPVLPVRPPWSTAQQSLLPPAHTVCRHPPFPWPSPKTGSWTFRGETDLLDPDWLNKICVNVSRPRGGGNYLKKNLHLVSYCPILCLLACLCLCELACHLSFCLSIHLSSIRLI